MTARPGEHADSPVPLKFECLTGSDKKGRDIYLEVATPLEPGSATGSRSAIAKLRQHLRDGICRDDDDLIAPIAVQA